MDRRMARKEIALALIAIGVLAWPVGFALEQEVPTILPVHLVFVLSGAFLKRATRHK